MVIGGCIWMIPRFCHRMYAVRKWNSAGMVCVFGHDLLNEYELDVHNTHYQWDELLHDGWKEEHFVLEILIHSVIMCILYFFALFDYDIENCMRENGNGWECDWLWYLRRTRFQSFITENEWAILQISFCSECGLW